MAKKIVTITILLMASLLTMAQDIITTIRGERIEANITAIDVHVIRYLTSGDTPGEISKSDVVSILFANGKTVIYRDLQTQQPATPQAVASVVADSGSPASQPVVLPGSAVQHPVIDTYPLPSLEELQWDYQRALSLRNTGTGLISSGSVLALLGIISPFIFSYDSSAAAVALILGYGIAAPIGTGLLIAGIPCYIVGNNRMAQAAFAIRHYSVNMPLLDSDKVNLSLGLAPAVVGLTLNF